MIGLLLNPGRLPLQLVLGFLLMIGSIPGQSEGLTCKTCDPTDPTCQKTVSKDCSTDPEIGADAAVCIKQVTGDKVKQDCMTKAIATCFQTSTMTTSYECFFMPQEDVTSMTAVLAHFMACATKTPGRRRRQAEAEGRLASENPTMEMTTIASTTDTGKMGYCFCETADCDTDFAKAQQIKLDMNGTVETVTTKPDVPDPNEATPAPVPRVPGPAPGPSTGEESSSAHRLDQVNSPILAIILMLTLPLYYGYIQGPM